MKEKSYQILLVIFMLLSLVCNSSCSSEDANTDLAGGIKQKVTIKAEIEADFKNTSTSSVEESASKVISAKGYTIWYAIYKKSDGSLVSQKALTNWQGESITDMLPQGEYTYCLFASTAYYDSYINIYPDPFDKVLCSFSNGTDDVFYRKFDVTVDKASVLQLMTLSRLVGKVIINVEDPQLIPANVGYMTLRGSNIPSKFYPSTYTMDYWEGPNIPDIYGITRADFLAAGKDQIVMYLLPNTSDFYKGQKTLDFSISLHEGSMSEEHHLLYTISIKKNVEIRRNEVVRISGELFKRIPSGMNISLEENWWSTTDQRFDPVVLQ